jgi:hypothetical protein
MVTQVLSLLELNASVMLFVTPAGFRITSFSTLMGPLVLRASCALLRVEHSLESVGLVDFNRSKMVSGNLAPKIGLPNPEASSHTLLRHPNEASFTAFDP